jgi:hypothetical protein
VDLRGSFVAYLCVTIANGVIAANSRMTRYGHNRRLKSGSARASASATRRRAPRRAMPEQTAAKTHLRAVSLVPSGRARADELIQPPGSLRALRVASAAACVASLHLCLPPAWRRAWPPARPRSTCLCHLRGDVRVGSSPHMRDCVN